MIVRLWRRVRAWNVRQDLLYLEVYLAACERQPRPDERHLRYLRGLIGLQIIKLAELEG